MGREIAHTDFTDDDFTAFRERLALETHSLSDWLNHGRVENVTGTCGLELEACLLDRTLRPAPENDRFITAVNDTLVVPELAKFNFEINTPPFPADSDMLSAMASHLDQRWRLCRKQAARLDLALCLAGVLPSLRDKDLHLGNVSGMQRYLALNQQILKGRRYQPLDILIEGERESLALRHSDVMTEAATTSLQIHLQLAPDDFARYYNASLLASAPMVAACANSPLVFGNVLWEESRIPLFEQSVAVPCFYGEQGDVVQRVTFGNGYLKHSAMELFEENLSAYPILLPFNYGQNTETPFAHLQLHNGTIWRWNRALVHVNAQQQAQLRLEHRALPAGPTITDCIGNIALFYGLVSWLADRPDFQLPDFSLVKHNFYQAARYGLNAELKWFNRTSMPAKALLLEQLIPAAHQQLEQLGFDKSDIDYFLAEVVGERVKREKTGAIWQRQFYQANGRNTAALMAAYQENCQRGAVYTW